MKAQVGGCFYSVFIVLTTKQKEIVRHEEMSGRSKCRVTFLTTDRTQQSRESVLVFIRVAYLSSIFPRRRSDHHSKVSYPFQLWMWPLLISLSFSFSSPFSSKSLPKKDGISTGLVLISTPILPHCQPHPLMTNSFSVYVHSTRPTVRLSTVKEGRNRGNSPVCSHLTQMKS